MLQSPQIIRVANTPSDAELQSLQSERARERETERETERNEKERHIKSHAMREDQVLIWDDDDDDGNSSST